nr:hypothetical protein [Tanacetum cinerariifolium]
AGPVHRGRHRHLLPAGARQPPPRPGTDHAGRVAGPVRHQLQHVGVRGHRPAARCHPDGTDGGGGVLHLCPASAPDPGAGLR